VHRLDEALALATIPHRPPRNGNTALQRRLADKALRPQLLEQFLPPHHPVTVLHQIRQHCEHLMIESDHLSSSV
jgi:hypothetical protein